VLQMHTITDHNFDVLYILENKIRSKKINVFFPNLTTILSVERNTFHSAQLLHQTPYVSVT